MKVRKSGRESDTKEIGRTEEFKDANPYSREDLLRKHNHGYGSLWNRNGASFKQNKRRCLEWRLFRNDAVVSVVRDKEEPGLKKTGDNVSEEN
jgi:hypothetical protein